MKDLKNNIFQSSIWNYSLQFFGFRRRQSSDKVNQDSGSEEDQSKITLLKCRACFRAYNTKIQRLHLQLLVGAH